MSEVEPDANEHRVDLSTEVWRLFQEGERYVDAEVLLRARLVDQPSDHWLLTRLGTALYEQRRYAAALGYTEEAHALAPRCPLVLWDLACTYQMLERHEEALRIYARLVRRGFARIADDECGEGLARARGMVADCHFRSSESFVTIGRTVAARNALDRHLALRGPGCQSIYAITEARALRQALNIAHNKRR